MTRFSVFIFLLCGISFSALGQVDERRARWEAGQAEQRSFEHRTFTRAGFPSIAEVQLAGRQVRRLLLQDPYMMLPVPGIEVERLADGRVTLRLQYPGWSSEPVEIDRTAWDRVTANDAALFARPEYRPVPQEVRTGPPAPPTAPPPPPPICHGWIARFEADYERTASWTQCGNYNADALPTAVLMVELAMSTKAECAFDREDPFHPFARCFMPTEALDDPQLEATYGELRRVLQGEGGADRLAAARRAVHVPGLTIGSQAWLEARALVAQVKEDNARRWESLRQLQQLSFGARTASEADRAKMRRAIANWTDFMQGQDRNLLGLVEGLAWPRE